ncbi:pentatricopeptide repeat-containing protein At1g11630, mitochondrial-like [Ananas comosus]|uniref:Pentatricopeptide repeat-containing protein At1g11630, mitochondrial-like n=1 Tax=Ananas comosus TaxID=4615 RepID=A0A6P5FCV1_ANACO|nr:pentatricopeptide repeat-containing protein At1g11630, mitochondrial-like [Ananas comosus]
MALQLLLAHKITTPPPAAARQSPPPARLSPPSRPSPLLSPPSSSSSCIISFVFFVVFGLLLLRHISLQRLKCFDPAPRPTRSAWRSSSFGVGQRPRFYASAPALLHRRAEALPRLSRRPDLVRRLLDPLLASPLAPASEGFLARVLSLYSSASLPDAAADAFLRPPPHPRSDLALSALLSAFLHNRRFRDLRLAFDRAHPPPGVASHNVLLRALCETGDVAGARNLLDEMSRPDNSRPAPNVVSYNTLLTAYLKNSGEGAGDEDLDEKFDEILHEIARRGIEPSVVTFNCRIARFCAKGESFKAEELLDVMLAKGIRPNLGTFNALIAGFCKEGDADAAVGVFKRMKAMKRRNGSDGVAPNADTYVALLRALIWKGDFEGALGICRECLARKVAPPFEVTKGLIEGLVRESKVEEARDVAEKMRAVVRGDAKDAWDKVEGELSLEKGTEDSGQ